MSGNFWHYKLASIVILSYNSKEDLVECIPSLVSQTYSNLELIVVDNASTDGSEEFIKTYYPEIKIVQTGKNLGYAGGNNAGIVVAKGEYIIVVNPDTVADPEWLFELIKPLENDNNITATTSKVLMYHQKDKINACAIVSHYTGVSFSRGLNKPTSEFGDYEIVAAVAGGSFAIRSCVLKDLEGFDPDFFLYQEDTDLSWRILFAGGKIMYVPKSIIYHKFKQFIPPWKEFYLERNRYLLLLKNFNSTTLLLLLPSLILTEILTIGHAFLNGPKYIKNKFLAYLWILKNINLILTKRYKTLSKKKISDKEFLAFLDWKIPFEQVIQNSLMSRVVDIIFNSFYKLHMILIKRIV